MKLLSIYTIAILLSGCYSSKVGLIRETHKDLTSFSEILVDTSVIACFSDSGHPHQIIDSSVCQLNASDLQTIEYLLINSVNDYNLNEAKELREDDTFYSRRQLRKGDYIIDLKNYKRQYNVGINSDGEKVVGIRFYCDPVQFDWKHQRVLVKDGGNCYFQTGINITKNESFYLYINGMG